MSSSRSAVGPKGKSRHRSVHRTSAGSPPLSAPPGQPVQHRQRGQTTSHLPAPKSRPHRRGRRPGLPRGPVAITASPGRPAFPTAPVGPRNRVLTEHAPASSGAEGGRRRTAGRAEGTRAHRRPEPACPAGKEPPSRAPQCFRGAAVAPAPLRAGPTGGENSGATPQREPGTFAGRKGPEPARESGTPLTGWPRRPRPAPQAAARCSSAPSRRRRRFSGEIWRAPTNSRERPEAPITQSEGSSRSTQPNSNHRRGPRGGGPAAPRMRCAQARGAPIAAGARGGGGPLGTLGKVSGARAPRTAGFSLACAACCSGRGMSGRPRGSRPTPSGPEAGSAPRAGGARRR